MSFKVSFKPWTELPWFLPRKSEVEYDVNLERLLFTRHRSGTVLPALTKLIAGARKRVFCCSFLLGSNKLSQALIDATYRLKGHVYVLTALDEKKLARGLADDVDPDHLDRARLAFNSLAQEGIYSRGVSDCHAKFCVVDDSFALLGSPNFDSNGLADGGDAAGEVAIIVEGKRAQHLGRLFRHLWKTAAEIEAPPSRHGYMLRSVTRHGSIQLDAPPPQNGMPFWTGFGSTGVLDHIRWTVQEAKHTLFLATYSVVNLDDKGTKALEDDILKAVKRGVDVQLYLRSQTRNLSHISKLAKAGVHVRADRINHAKYAITDERVASLFSANLDGNHGLTSGCETGIRLTNGKEVEEVVRLHRMWWNACEAEVGYLATPEILLRRCGWLSKGWPGEATTIRLGGPQAKEAEELLRHPSLLLQIAGQQNKFLLIAADMALNIHQDNNTWIAQSQASKDRLPTPTIILAGGLHNKYNKGWIPVDVQVN